MMLSECMILRATKVPITTWSGLNCSLLGWRGSGGVRRMALVIVGLLRYSATRCGVWLWLWYGVVMFVFDCVVLGCFEMIRAEER